MNAIEAEANLQRARETFDMANADYMRRLNDPDAFLPTHSGPGRLAWLQSVSRMERAADVLRAAEDAYGRLERPAGEGR